MGVQGEKQCCSHAEKVAGKTGMSVAKCLFVPQVSEARSAEREVKNCVSGSQTSTCVDGRYIRYTSSF